MNSTFRDRILLLKLLPASGWAPVTALVAVQAAGALMPALTALAMGFLVSRVAHGSTAVALPLLALGGAFLVSRLTQELTVPLTYLVTQRIDGAHRAELVRLVAGSPTIDPLERGRVRELLRLSRGEREFWGERTPGQGAVAQLDLTTRYFGLVASCAVLLGYAWWLVPVIVGPAMLCRAKWRREFTSSLSMDRVGVKEEIRARHWTNLATEWTGGKEVRTFGLADWAVGKAHGHVLAQCEPAWASGERSARGQWIIALIVGPPLLAAYLLVVHGTLDGSHTVAAQTVVLSTIWSVLNTLSFSDALEIDGAVPGVKAGLELRDELRPAARPAAEVSTGGATAPPTGPPVIRFEDVTFRYPGTSRAVLEGVTLSLHPGELLALVGLNGAGKSTLIKLLSGLYRPTSGRITVDGVDLARIAPEEWRRRLTVVFQDFVRYPLSLADNVSLGAGDIAPDPDLIRRAVSDAGFDRVLAGLPDGLDTPLARSRRGGVDLSGGQWQQVVLARALYAAGSGAGLLVLDEPTAHLDVRTELDMFQRIQERRGTAGVVLISHRLSTVRSADRIVLLDGGRITEDGTHDALMAKDGTYAELFTIQAERFAHGYDDRFEGSAS